MIVVNELLGYPRLKIYQDTEMFSFSIDSVLLADFVTISRKDKMIMDFCTGNAPIPMFLTLRTNAKIHAVEIQKKSYDLAVMSVKENHLEDQIELFNDDINNLRLKYPHRTFDVITCNPPFFKVTEESHVNEIEEKMIARHEVAMTLEDAIKQASYLLKDNGHFAMVHRPERLTDIMVLLDKYHLEPKRLRFVYPAEGKECNHILIEAMKTRKKGGLRILPPLYVYDENRVWTKEVLKIYNYNKEE